MIYLLKCSGNPSFNRYFIHEKNAIEALDIIYEDLITRNIHVQMRTPTLFTFDYYSSKGTITYYIETIKPEDYLDVFK